MGIITKGTTLIPDEEPYLFKMLNDLNTYWRARQTLVRLDLLQLVDKLSATYTDHILKFFVFYTLAF
jgi:hypothetical protein